MFCTLRVIPSLDLRGWAIEINGDLIGPVFETARDATRVYAWLLAASTELDLLFHTDWDLEGPPDPDWENLDPVS